MLAPFDSALNLRPYYWTIFAIVLVVLFVNFRLRDSKLGRAWIALREDEVAAASMGVPLVKTKLLSYATGGALGGISGAFLGAYFSSVNANSFQFGFSIFILGMVILGGLGSIWGVVIGAILLSFVNIYLIPDVLDQGFVGDTLTGPRARLHLHRDLVRGVRLRPRDHDGAATRGHTARAKAPDGAQGGHRRDRVGLRGARMSSNGSILSTVSTTKVFGGLMAVSDVSIDVAPKSIVSIIGPNGAGKTTFFNMLTGLYRPTAGRILFDGRDVTGTRPDLITAAGVARTFQNIRLFSTMSALENVMVGCHARMKAGLFGSILRTPSVRREEAEVTEKAHEMLEYVGLGE